MIDESKISFQEIFVFHHLPKTAGSSLNQALVEIFNPTSNFIGVNSGKQLEVEVERYLSFDEEQRKQVKCLTGHNLIELLKFFPNQKKSIFFRDPLEHLISHYHFHSKADKNTNRIRPPLVELDSDKIKENLTNFALERRIHGEDKSNPNYQAQCLLYFLEQEVSDISEEILLNCLSKFEFVGSSSLFSLSMFLLSQVLGISEPNNLIQYHKINQTDYTKIMLDDSCRQYFRDFLHYDYFLHEYTVNKLDETFDSICDDLDTLNIYMKFIGERVQS